MIQKKYKLLQRPFEENSHKDKAFIKEVAQLIQDFL